MAIENVRHPIKDTVKADNSTYSSNKIESLIHSATELPETSIEDAGDVLMVNDEGEWDKGEIIVPQELPTPAAADIGKIVSVVSDGDEGAEYSLENAPTELPEITAGDIRDSRCLAVKTDGTLYWSARADSFLLKKGSDGKYSHETLTPGLLGNLFTDEVLVLFLPTSMGTIVLHQESFEIDMSVGTMAFRFGNIFSDGTHFYHKYIDIPLSDPTAPISNITLNSVTIV